MKFPEDPTKVTLDDAKSLCAQLRPQLQKQVHASQLSLNSKTPFRAMVLREGLAHRAADLLDGAISEFVAGRWVGGTSLVRAAIETTAVLHCLGRKTEAALAARNDDALTEFLHRGSLGSRSDDRLPQAISVLTAVDTTNKEFPGFKRSYEILSEYAHPNWCGVLGAYSDLEDKFTVSFGNTQPFSDNHHAAGIISALVVLENAYNQAGKSILDLNAAFDSGLITYDA